MFSTTLLFAALGVFTHLGTITHGCQLPSEWRPLSEGCRAELAEIIVYARVLAIHREPLGGGAGSLYNSLPFGFGYGYEGAEEGLLYSAEVELLCDQAWGSMLEVPTGSRLNLTGLGYLSCQSHTVMENYSYFFFLRMDENYNILPHGVNFQDAIFPDTSENRRTFSSLFQFSNCTQGSQPFHTFSPEWDTQEDSRMKIKVMTDDWSRSDCLQTGYWLPQVKGQIAEIHIFDWQQFESVSLCNSDSYQFEATQPADLGPEISQDPVNRGRKLCCCDSGIYYHTSSE
ncbi:Coiled-coil domain-containing protein 3 [Nibea albiflora]|uniref:Coiled-coil domain-containing protein 3 n=1 Tax=Nibea albiflora TaxID=240163 RepID=A0ACB7EV89_NIBAL|nr:Coiled-coil domain-containing protein 3 [Nibea albiflora]